MLDIPLHRQRQPLANTLRWRVAQQSLGFADVGQTVAHVASAKVPVLGLGTLQVGVAGQQVEVQLGIQLVEGRAFAPESCAGIGINGTDCLDELEKSKPTSFVGSVLLSARSHGYETVTMMFHWIRDGTEPPLDTRTSGVLITRANFRQVLQEQGVRD